MKVMITMPKTASVAVDFEYGDAWEMFRDLSARLIGEPHGEVAKESKESSAEVKPRNLLEEKVEIKSQEVQAIAAIPIFDDNPALEPEERLLLKAVETYTYRGFIYIRCSECGNIYGYHSKTESDTSHCRKCGHDLRFTEPLIPMFLECECGRHFRYMTNLNEFAFDVNCIECGSPVSVKYSAAKNRYETIK